MVCPNGETDHQFGVDKQGRPESLPCADSAAEQRRIVAKIDELFSDLDAGVAALETGQGQPEALPSRRIEVGGQGRLTDEWRKERPKETGPELLTRILGERRHKWEEEQLATFAKAGKSPPAKWKDRYKEPAGPDC